jgi:hypothetical protein
MLLVMCNQYQYGIHQHHQHRYHGSSPLHRLDRHHRLQVQAIQQLVLKVHHQTNKRLLGQCCCHGDHEVARLRH